MVRQVTSSVKTIWTLPLDTQAIVVETYVQGLRYTYRTYMPSGRPRSLTPHPICNVPSVFSKHDRPKDWLTFFTSLLSDLLGPSVPIRVHGPGTLSRLERKMMKNCCCDSADLVFFSSEIENRKERCRMTCRGSQGSRRGDIWSWEQWI